MARTGRSTRWASAAVLTAVLLGSACSAVDSSGAAPGPTSTIPQLLRDVPEPVVEIAYLMQDELTTLGYDVGRIDAGFTKRATLALRQFQQQHGLPPTGAIDQATAVALRTAAGRTQPTIVRGIQSVLTELGLYRARVDGNYGPETTAAVSALQHRAHLGANTGAVDAATLVAMVQQWRAQNLPAPVVPAPPAQSGVLQPGDRGPAVSQLQGRLAALEYRPGTPDGNFGVATESAVVAFEKHEGLARDGAVGSAVRAHLAGPTGAGPRSTKPTHIEVDLDRQIAFVVLPSGVTVLDVSTGSGQAYTDPGSTQVQVAYTPTGTFSVYRAVDTPVVAPLGTLYKPLYFKQGWAMHGEPLVPPYPASHGCVRTHDWDQDWLFPHIPVGTRIVIYGSSSAAANRPANAGAGY